MEYMRNSASYNQGKGEMVMNKFDKALERINKLVEPQDDWTDEDIKHFKTVVEALKIASKEVRHGEWSIAIGYDINKKVKCSVCELMTYEPMKYCPHCGAKMDGGNLSAIPTGSKRVIHNG